MNISLHADPKSASNVLTQLQETRDAFDSVAADYALLTAEAQSADSLRLRSMAINSTKPPSVTLTGPA